MIASIMKKALNIIFPVAITVFLILSVFRCDNPGDGVIVELPPGVIFGAVVDSPGNSPLENAMIGIDSMFDTTYYFFETTDSMGLYRYPTMDLEGRLYCGKDGYLTKTTPYQVAHGESIRVDFNLVHR